jgi:hypothetical protein
MPVRFDLSVLFRRLSAKFALALLVGIVAITLATFTTRAWLIKSVPASANSQEIAAAQGQPAPARIEAVLITAHPHGFEPNAITRPKGRFLLAVDNRTGLNNPIILRVDRVTGNRLHEASVPREKSRWRNFFDLPPGQYKLTEAAHPEWVCDITITP